MSPVVTVRALGGRGVGVADVDGETWMVSGALPGEVLQARETGRRAGIVQATTESVLDTPHPAREPSPCPQPGLCGGCDWGHVRPESGAPLKAEVAAGAARSFPEGAEALRSAPVHPSPDGYRLRARLHWDPQRRALGFFAPRSWEVTPAGSCPVLSPRLSAALETLAEALSATCPDPVDLEWLETLSGDRAVAALRPGRNGPPTVPVEHLPAPGRVEAAVDGWHVTARSGHIIGGWGPISVRMELPTPLEVPIGAFFQVNRHLVPDLFYRVGELAGTEPLPLWDLHAGVGFLAAAAAGSGDRSMVLTEPFRPAAQAAARNLPGARVFVGRTAEAYLRHHRRLPSEALVLLDPPRAGLEPALRNALAGWRPVRLVLLSCDPATWARDARFLLQRGFRLASVELFDLFPRTHHVEVLSVLEPL